MSAEVTQPRQRSRSYRRLLATVVLVSEALVIGFATLVAKDLSDLSDSRAYLAGAVGALLCVVAAATLRSRAGFLLGWLVQLLLIASAAWVPIMLAIGLGFAVLWVVVLVQGSRADALTVRREREARAAVRAARDDGPGVGPGAAG